MTAAAAAVPAPGRRRRWLGLAFLAFVPLLLAALAVWFGSEYRRLGGSEDDVQRAHVRQLQYVELFSAIKDAETGQRGFVITGTEAFLAPYRHGEAAVGRHLAELREAPMRPAERRRLDRLEALIAAKFDEMERVLSLRRTHGVGVAGDAVREGRGKRLMDRIRQEAADARFAEAMQLRETLARQNARTQLTVQVAWAVVAIVTLIFIGIGILFWRAERDRVVLERRAFEAAARRQAIFDNTLDAIVLINPSGSIETINRSASRLFGYGESQIMRRDISLVADLAPGEGPFLERVGLGPEGELDEPFRHNLAARHADGSPLAVEVTLAPMPLPDGTHIVAAFRDISEREKVERIKDQFLSTVSHELRTPLTSIVGSLALLRGGASGEMAPGVQRLLVIAENNAGRLIRLVNDLLDIEKLESGKMSFDFEPMDLRETAARALDGVRGAAHERDVRLEMDMRGDPVTVRGDADRLIQVLTNLLANAARFTPPGKAVTLTVERRTSHAEVSVIDEGPGIDEELRSRLFTRFAQSIQAPVGTARGTGLGLAISREIVRAHGGSIWYEPAPGGGSVFSFNLPLWDVVTDRPGPGSGLGNGNGSGSGIGHDTGCAARVLIRSGDGEAGRIVAALENRKVCADIVHDTPAMFEALRRERYIALLLDFRSLGADSALLRRIRAEPNARTLPIIAIAAGDETDTPNVGLLDVVDWIPRPLDGARLDEALGAVMERAAVRMPMVLHVDDDTDTLEITAGALAGRARMARATDLAAARALIARNRPDIVIIDLALPDGSGEELVAELASSGDLSTPVIIYSAQERNGAFAREVSAVLTKSKRSLSALVDTVVEILDRTPQEGRSDGR